MLNENQNYHSLKDRPIWITIEYPLDCFRVLIAISFVAFLVTIRFACDKQNWHIDRDRYNRDDFHDIGPAANTFGTLSLESSIVARHLIELYFYLKKVREKWKQRCQREHSCKEHDISQLYNGLIVV